MNKFLSLNISLQDINITFDSSSLKKLRKFLLKYEVPILIIILSIISVCAFIFYYQNGLGIAYNDARSHLNISRRVVEGLTPGLAQLGSVWLPLPHVLMLPFIWNDFMWHSGLAGGLVSMVAYVATGYVIYKLLKELSVGVIGRLIGVFIFALNINILYLQSTAMTELLLLFTMTISIYYLVMWNKYTNLKYLVLTAFGVMLSTAIRYDGWFLMLVAATVVVITLLQQRGYKVAEGALVLYGTLASFGIALWFLWNLLIFGDPLYFMFGPFSAHSQQEQIDAAGQLLTKGNLFLSAKVYFYAVMYNSYTLIPIMSLIGAYFLIKDKILSIPTKFACMALFSSLLFNIIALYQGHSVLFIPEIMGNTWFNIRYGVMLLPTIAIFTAFLFDRLKFARVLLFGLIIMVYFFAFNNYDSVTIDDARFGSSQKNVNEVSSWLKENAADKDGYVLISAASHDAIIFSSGMQMNKFIHEGTGKYWQSAIENPDQWVKWIIMRTNDLTDLTFRNVYQSEGFQKYEKVKEYPFADIYQLTDIETEPDLSRQN